jgi:predicted Mrr-cat superfamily restriction endonuclease
MNKAWVIKLGSAGSCVPFCERNGIVGIGWSDVRYEIASKASRSDLKKHITESCSWYTNERERGAATGQIFRFCQECQIGDYILYYVPNKKWVAFTKVMSGPLFRDFDPQDRSDIYHFRRVEIAREPMPILDLYGPLKATVLGPRMSFWEAGSFEIVDQIARGISPMIAKAADPEVEAAYRMLSNLLVVRSHGLNDKEWEWLVVDYFKAQGAHVDERKVGGNRPIIDAEAIFDHGELGHETWRIQVKCYQNRAVDWSEIKSDFDNVGSDVRFCFVSASGFTGEARAQSYELDIRLLEAADFARFFLSGKMRESIAAKLKIPQLGASQLP